MRCICINLDRSPDRWASIEKQAAALGLRIERLPAVDGRALVDPPNFPISASAIGCFLSHRALWKEVASGPDDFVLALEDDVLLSPELPAYLADTSWIPGDADIVHIGGVDARCFVQGLGRKVKDRRLYRSVRCTGGEAYILSRQCAEHLASDFLTVDREYDQIIFKGGRPDLKIYKLLPALCTQDRVNFSSSIERASKARLSTRAKLRRNLIGAAKRSAGWLQLVHRQKVLYR